MINSLVIQRPFYSLFAFQQMTAIQKKILKSAYYQQIEDGSLEEFGDLPYSLFQGLHFCEDTCAKGHPLNDWEATKVASATRVVLANNIFPMLLLRTRQFWRRERKCCSGTHWLRPAVFETRFLIRLNLAFVGAHRYDFFFCKIFIWRHHQLFFRFTPVTVLYSSPQIRQESFREPICVESVDIG